MTRFFSFILKWLEKQVWSQSCFEFCPHDLKKSIRKCHQHSIPLNNSGSLLKIEKKKESAPVDFEV